MSVALDAVLEYVNFTWMVTPSTSSVKFEQVTTFAAVDAPVEHVP